RRLALPRPFPEVCGVLLLRGRSQRAKGRLSVCACPRHSVKRAENVGAPRLAVEIALVAGKVPAQEVFVEALFAEVESQLPTVQFHHCMRHPQRWHAGRTEKFVTDPFTQISGILSRIIQVVLLKPVESLPPL